MCNRFDANDKSSVLSTNKHARHCQPRWQAMLQPACSRKYCSWSCCCSSCSRPKRPEMHMMWSHLFVCLELQQGWAQHTSTHTLHCCRPENMQHATPQKPSSPLSPCPPAPKQQIYCANGPFNELKQTYSAADSTAQRYKSSTAPHACTQDGTSCQHLSVTGSCL